MEATRFTFEGKTYPARISMGALRAFRKETGRDFLKELATLTGEDLGVMLWGAIKAQCRVEGIPFDMGVDDFLDRVTPDEVSAWYNGSPGTAIAEDAPEVSKKKTLPG